MLIFDVFNHAVTGYADFRHRSRTQRLVSQLSREIREDIGWSAGSRVPTNRLPDYWG